MGFAPSDLAALQAVEEGFMADTCLLLLPTTGNDALNNPNATSYTAVATPIQLWQEKRIAKVGEADRVQDLTDWKGSVPLGTVVSPLHKILSKCLRWMGEKDNTTSYLTGDGVSVGLKFYRALGANTGQPVTNLSVWVPVSVFDVMGVGDMATDSPSIILDLKLVQP